MKIAPVDATMSFPIRMVRLRSFSIPALLFGLSLFFRVWNLDSDVFSDEAYYYYLTMFPEKYFSLHRNHPFLLYIVYHPFSQDLVTFRFVNILVGSLVPVLVYVLLASYNVRINLRIAGGVAAAINVILVRFSGIVFLDMLAVALLLLGCVFLRRGLWAFSGLTFGLSALVKEYALIAALILVAGVWFRTRSAKLTALCASSVGVAAVILAYIMFPMGGVNELIEGVARGQAIDQSEAIYLMLFALAGLTALFLRLYEESLIVIGYATVVLAGGFNLEWYLILPMPFLILCVVAFLIGSSPN
jgi:uncharacterized membrane protein